MDRIYGVRVTPSQLLLALPFAAKWEVLIIHFSTSASGTYLRFHAVELSVKVVVQLMR